MQQQQATVIATYSRRMRIRLSAGEEIDARIKGKRLKPVCGDRVIAEPIERESDWLITNILARDNELSRPNLRGKTEVLAANIELLVVVTASSPRPDWSIVDRYLCAASLMRIPAIVVYNKSDLSIQDDVADRALTEYIQIGYAVVRCSARTGNDLSELSAHFEGHTAIVVGQSGVGKSSIVNALMGNESLRTAAISEKTGEGRHTTVNSRMLKLPSGGQVIDSPGVRDYAPALNNADDVNRGFREIYETSEGCRFGNCRHIEEPDCAVKAAVIDGTISERRYKSYRHQLALTERLSRN